MIFSLAIVVILIFIFGGKGMRAFKRLFSVFKGTVVDKVEEINRENKLTIFKQKIREAEEALEKSTDALTDIMASCKQEKRDIDDINKRLEQNEVIIKECIRKEKKDLALEVAQKIGELEDELKHKRLHEKKLQEAIELITSKRKDIADKIDSMKHQVNLFMSQESVNEALRKTVEIVGEGYSINNESLDAMAQEIEDNQLFDMDKIYAGQELYNKDTAKDLEGKLEKEGISRGKFSVDEILKRYE